MTGVTKIESSNSTNLASFELDSHETVQFSSRPFGASLGAQVIPPQLSKFPNGTPRPGAAQSKGARPQAKPVAVEVNSFKLLSSTTGWASTGKALIWTNDNGQHWKDITPPNPHYHRLDNYSSLVDVFFLDEQTGWVLLCYHPASGTDFWAFDISETQDGGQTWVTNPVVAPDLDSGRLGDKGYISFSDALHGWANLNIQSGSAFSVGALLVTVNGGKTWSSVAGDPGMSGPVLLQENGNGWLINAASELQATLDQGKTFHQVQLPVPTGLSIQADSSHTIYGLPSFVDNQNGFEPVVFTTSAGSQSEMVLFATKDGGSTWTPDRKLTNLGLTSLNTVGSISIVDTSWIVPVGPRGRKPTLEVIPGGEVSQYPSATPNGVRASSLISLMQGWILCKSGLLSTSDGGNTWLNISPTFTFGKGLGSSYSRTPQVNFSYGPSPISKGTAASELAGRLLTNDDNPPPIASGTAQNLGFDITSIPSTDQMLDWWNNSPYYIFGFYLNGLNSHGSGSHAYQPGLTKDYISTVRSYGWGLLPIWSGKQAPCACWQGRGTYPTCRRYRNVFNSDPVTAANEGADDADAAYNSAVGLNLDGGIIYVDIEVFDSSVCGAAAQAFLGGFVAEINLNSGTASGGVYGSVSNADPDFLNASPRPSNVFLAWSNKRFSVWNLGTYLE